MRITRIPDLFAILSLPLTTVLFSGQPLGTQSGIPTVSTVMMTSNLGTGESYATDDSANSTLTYSAMTSAGHKVDTEVLIPGNGAQQDHWPDSISAVQSFHCESILHDNREYDITRIALNVKTPSDALEVTVRIGGPAKRKEFTYTGSVTSARHKPSRAVRTPRRESICRPPILRLTFAYKPTAIKRGRPIDEPRS